jgi:hypothetical protein
MYKSFKVKEKGSEVNEMNSYFVNNYKSTQ